jgi:hypothetical protein
MQQLCEGSDRVVLTVRLTRDGHREWLDYTGKVALVFYERGCWWGRRSASSERFSFSTYECAALDYVLDPTIRELRDTLRTDL